MSKLVSFATLIALVSIMTGCESPAASTTIELPLRQVGPQDQIDDEILAEVSLVGGTCDLGPCFPNPCLDAATIEGEEYLASQTRCQAMGMNFVCTCPAGERLQEDMETMESSCVPDEDCRGTTCNRHGMCMNMEGTLSCECDEGYLGPNCTQCDEDNGFYNNGEGGCEQDVPVCRIAGAQEFRAFLAEAEESLGRPPLEISITRLDINIDEESALVVRSWPAIFPNDLDAYVRTYDGFPHDAAYFEIWDEEENDEFVSGSETFPAIEGDVVVGRQVLKAEPEFLLGEFAVGIRGETGLEPTQGYGFDATVTMEIEAY